MTAFRTHTDAFERANAQVLGVSVDSFAAAGRFQEDLGLEFPLVSDFPKNQFGHDYGVYNEKGSVLDRVTFVIDKDRVIRAIYSEPADFESHPRAALDALKEMGEQVD